MGVKNKEKKEKNQGRSGAEYSERPIIWEDRNKPVPKSSLEHLRDYNN